MNQDRPYSNVAPGDTANSPCPFCGAQLGGLSASGYHHHPSNACLLSGFELAADDIAGWNRRAAQLQSAPATGPAPSPERLLDISRTTGLRDFLHGVSAVNSREILHKYVGAVLADMLTSSVGNEPNPDAGSDKELLDWLERHASTGLSFDLATITFPVPEHFEGANTLRDLVRSAIEHADSEQSQGEGDR
ncbi:hypothetical protein [Paraburkholderia sediminicola]|uniref:hypothetical protein n=1 Tax=Paraburkholderia sediminicola TaxID=458836 RepID=UPI0038B96A2D